MKKFALLILTVALIPTLSFSQNQGAGTYHNAMLKGDNLLRVGFLEQALEFYNQGLAIDPSVAELYQKRARLYSMMRRTSEARADYDHAIRLNPYSAILFDERARLRYQAKDFKGAEEDYDQAIELDPYNATISAHKLDFYLLSEQYIKAGENLNTSSSTDSSEQTKQLRKAYLLLAQDRLDSMNILLEEILIEDEDCSIAHDLQGIYYLNIEEWTNAIDAFTEAIKANPKFALAYYNRSIAYKLTGNSKAALLDIDKSAELLTDTPSILFTRALYKKQIGDLEGAMNDYNKVVGLSPDYTEALFNRAFLKKFLGDYNSALADIDRALDQDPNDPKAYNLKGNIQAMFDQFDEAIISYNTALEIDPDYAKAHFNRGLTYIMINRPVEGCTDLYEAESLEYLPASEKIKAFCLRK